MPAAGGGNTRKRQRRKAQPQRLVPHGPGGQRLRPAAPVRIAPRTPAAKRQGVKVVQRASDRATPRSQSYVSQGQAVEKRANQLGRQTSRYHTYDKRGGPLDLKGALQLIYGRPGRKGAVRGGLPGATVGTAPLAQLPTARAVARDVKTLGEGPFIGGYELGRGGYEALTGRGTARLGRLGSGVLSGIVHSAPGELAQLHPGKALTQIQKHPLISALDFSAGASAAGKLAGAGARAASGYRLGSTVRPPLALSRDAGAVKAGAYREREYPKGLDRQIPQRLRDSKREPVRDSNGKVVTVEQRGRQVPVLKPTRGEQRRGNVKEADRRAGRANAAERLSRERQGRTAKIKGVRGQRGRDLVAMVYEGAVPSLKHIDAEGHVMTGPAAFERYLRDHAARLDREYERRMKADPKGYRHSDEALHNRYRAELARDAANDPRVSRQAEKIVAEGTRLGREGRRLDVEAAKVGVISDEARATGAALIPGKIEHLGGRHFTVAEHTRLEREALAAEERAKDALLGVRQSKGKAPGGGERRELGRLPQGTRQLKLRREYEAARAHRIAVSGRDPKGVRAHEAASATHAAATETAKRVGTRIARLVKERNEKIALHRRERASSGGSPSMLAAADQGVKAVRDGVDRLEKQLARLEVSMGRASKRGDTAKMEELQGHIETLSKKRAEERARLSRLEKQRDLFKATPQRVYHVGGKRFATRAEAATYKKQHGGEITHTALTKEEAARTGEIVRLNRAIKAAKKERLEAETAARKAGHELKQTRMPPIRAAIRTAEGKHLPDSEIERFYRSRGRDPETVGYLPHVPPQNRAFHQRYAPGTRPVADKAGPQGTRTGEAYRKGATESSADLIRQQHVKLRTQIVKAEQLDKLVRERGLRHPEYEALLKRAQAGEQLSKRERRLVDNGGYLTGREAEEFGKRIIVDTGTIRKTPREVLLAPDGEHLLPMRAYADRLSDETKRIIREDLQGPGSMDSLAQYLLNDRVIPPSELGRVPSRNVVLMPADVVMRLEKHLAPASELERMVQMLNAPFRFAVLAQLRWLVGNFVEPYLVRLPTVGSGAVNIPGLLNDIRISMKTLKAAHKSGDAAQISAAEEVLAQHAGGLFLGGRGASNRRMFDESEVYKKIVAKVPATRQMFELSHKVGQVLMAPGRAYFLANRELIEKWAQHASLGRSIRRDMTEFHRSWGKAARFGEEAAREAAKGLVNTPTQFRFLREQHKLLGQYGDFSPIVRRIVQGPMPFLPWALNAARFVYWTMPAERTILTALLVKTQQVVAKEWDAEHAATPPGGLKLAIPRKDGGLVDAARYTPYGLTGPVAEGDTEGLNQAFPQLQGPLQAATLGLDPFGRPLQTEKTADNPQGRVQGLPARLGVAGNELAEGLLPYIAQIRRLREHGETALSTSNVISPKTKPGTSHGMSAARRTFDPFRPTYLRAPNAVSAPAAHHHQADVDEILGLDSPAQSEVDADVEEIRRLK